MPSRYLEPEVERRSRAAMTRWQSAKLGEQVRHAAAHSPFYRRKFKAAGVNAARVRGLGDLHALPLIVGVIKPVLGHCPPRWTARTNPGRDAWLRVAPASAGPCLIQHG
jgi:hypothetical protein